MTQRDRFDWTGGEIAPRVVLAIASLFFIGCLIATMPGCNTVEGIARDVGGAWDGMMSIREGNGDPVRRRSP